MRANMQNYRFEFLNKLKTALGDKVTICDEFDEIHRENFYSVSINLGTGWAGSYKGGYWGDCTITCLLYTSPSPRDGCRSRMPSSA